MLRLFVINISLSSTPINKITPPLTNSDKCHNFPRSSGTVLISLDSARWSHTGRESQFLPTPPAFKAPVGGGCLSEYCHALWRGRTRMVWLPDGENILKTFRQNVRTWQTDRQTEGQTDTVTEVAGSTHTRSTASNLEQVANLLCAQANSASYLQHSIATRGKKTNVLTWYLKISALGHSQLNRKLSNKFNIMWCDHCQLLEKLETWMFVNPWSQHPIWLNWNGWVQLGGGLWSLLWLDSIQQNVVTFSRDPVFLLAASMGQPVWHWQSATALCSNYCSAKQHVKHLSV